MTYTVAQLAALLAPDADEAERTRIARQVRHWTTGGALYTSGPLHGGTGRHRTYAVAETFKAALLLEMSRYNLPVGWMKEAGYMLHGFARDKQAHWTAATTGDGRREHKGNDGMRSREPIYFGFTARPSSAGKTASQAFIGYGFELQNMLNAMGSPSHLVANLTALFTTLRS